MANIPIWPGSSSFGLVADPTPFGFYDDDDQFRIDADKVSQWVVQRLGYPLVDIELQDINLYSCFEEATSEYGAQVYNATIVYNFGSLINTITGSTDQTLNNIVIDSNYGTSAGGGASQEAAGSTGNAGAASSLGRTYSGSIVMRPGQQNYDLYDTNTTSTVAGLTDSTGASITGSITITKIYHEAPSAINRYFDPYAGTGTGIQSLMQSFGFGNYSPGVNFMLMPLYFDVLKLQAIEFNDQIRKSGYHFELENGRYLKIFPVPTGHYTLWYEYKNSYNPNTGTTGPDLTSDDSGNSKPLDRVTNISNANYTAPIYAYINEPGRQWIRKYTLALAKEMLGSVRGKYQSIPIPGSDTTLDYSRLLSEATAEKEALITTLRSDLELTSKEKQLEREASEKESRKASAGNDPVFIYIG